jgi:hypothetical protein
MIKEMRGRCMICFFGGRNENDKHELQRCRYVSDLRWRLMLGLDSCLNFVYTVRVGNILGEIVRRVNSREEAAALYVDCHRRHMERIFMEMSELGSAQM